MAVACHTSWSFDPLQHILGYTVPKENKFRLIIFVNKIVLEFCYSWLNKKWYWDILSALWFPKSCFPHCISILQEVKTSQKAFQSVIQMSYRSCMSHQLKLWSFAAYWVLKFQKKICLGWLYLLAPKELYTWYCPMTIPPFEHTPVLNNNFEYWCRDDFVDCDFYED